LSDSSNKFSSVHIDENFLAAHADYDDEARLIAEAWKPRFNIVTIDKDDPALDAGWEIHFV
jgi:hypothetical protein